VCSFGLTLIMANDPNAAFIFPAMAISMPAFVLMTTNSISLMGLTGLVMIYTALTKFKFALGFLFENMEVEEFIERLGNAVTVAVIFYMILFGLVLVALDKRTRELDRSKKQTESALEKQRTFIFSFSHELRNPLNSLLGNLQLVLMSAIPSETKEIIQSAKVCGELLLQLINNVLDTGKSELGSLEVSPTETKVHYLFQRIWNISTELIKRKDLQGHLKIEKKTPPLLLLDSHRIDQIMLNLIGNAIKFTSKGSINVTLKYLQSNLITDECFEPIPYDPESEGVFEKDDGLYMLKMNKAAFNKRNQHPLRPQEQPSQQSFSKDDEYYILPNKQRDLLDVGGATIPKNSKGIIKIIVEDTGCGMTETMLSKLFQKFSQVCDDPSKRQTGTGLGLYITKEICKNMQGDIRVYSKPGVGTTFIVCIPTSVLSSQQHDHLIKSSLYMANVISRNNLRVIVADDSSFNVNMLYGFLKKLGIQLITTVENGNDAYVKYKDLRECGVMVDIVIMDIDVPRMNGQGACQKIREYEKWKDLKQQTMILFVSGNYNQEENFFKGAQSGAKGMNCLLKKPLLFEEVCHVIYKFLPK